MNTTLQQQVEEENERSTNDRMELIDVEELQERLGIGVDKSYELAHMENFPSRKIKGQWRVDWSAVKRDFREAPGEVKDLVEVWR